MAAKLVRCGACECGCDLREWWYCPVVEGDGLGWLLQCKPGEDRAGQGKGSREGRERQGRGQGTAVRRIEGFEKRQRAKPKRRPAHPPAFVRAFQDPPTPLGECRVVLLPACHCRGYVVLRTHCHARVCLFFAGVSLRRPRQSCWQVITRVGKSAVITGFMRIAWKMVIAADANTSLVGHQQACHVRQATACCRAKTTIDILLR